MPHNKPIAQSQSAPASMPPLRGAQLLKTQCDKANELIANRPVTSDNNQAWEAVTQNVLGQVFGIDSPNVAMVMDVGRYRYWAGDTEAEWEEARARDLKTRVAIMEGLIEMLDAESHDTSPPEQRTKYEPTRNSVFLVHGHNDGVTHETARFLEKLAAC